MTGKGKIADQSSHFLLTITRGAGIKILVPQELWLHQNPSDRVVVRKTQGSV